MKALKIMIADSQTIVRNGIKALLKDKLNYPVTIIEASNGVELIDQVTKENFDVLVIDTLLPKLDGINAIQMMQKNGINIPTITLINECEYYLIQKILEINSLGILSKNIESDELILAINNVMLNKKYYCNEVSQLLININQKKTQNFQLFDSLTSREKEILDMVVKEYTNDQIGAKLEISTRTVEGHRKNLKSKLKVKSTIGLIKYAFQQGL